MNATAQLVTVGDVQLAGDVTVPESAVGVVLFAHGSGSSRHSPRNRAVAEAFQRHGLATVLIDLLTTDEERLDALTRQWRFDIALLAGRLAGTIDWIRAEPTLTGLPIGLFGASTGAAAALVAAAQRPTDVRTVVSRGGRPDLAGAALPDVAAPTLFIVGALDAPVLELNRQAAAAMTAPTQLRIVPGATHLFEEPGTLEQVTVLASDWFGQHLGARR
ncbi:dienelactone hydrolase family protein [Dactylosporangium sp. NBC_01737]|uniref:dienelactone hydrolase family protein n=1 Tax=Dactylosporangium sp. NBC_01737 TaxID=2975959 RepID=UPI002E1237C7|nr:dienelactone hydrolase family protein [Dactylosporangium sp. NBC_01737]